MKINKENQQRKSTGKFFEGIKFALGILFVFSIVGLVYAVGFHFPYEILPGQFANGNYSFNGSLGIGTTNPQSKLDVDGTITSSEVIGFYLYSDSAPSTNMHLVLNWTGWGYNPLDRKYNIYSELNNTRTTTDWQFLLRNGTVHSVGWSYSDASNFYGIGNGFSNAINSGTYGDWFTLYFDIDNQNITFNSCFKCTPIVKVSYDEVIPLVPGDVIIAAGGAFLQK